MSKKQKFYVVWKGHQTGVFDDWTLCKKQIDGYPNALYKSFPSRIEATRAFQGNPFQYFESQKSIKKTSPIGTRPSHRAICVDAACSGNPGDMEYRGVDYISGQEIFRKGPYPMGTNNIGEFLAIVHGIGWQIRNGFQIPIYSDSATAISWVRNKKAKTKLEETLENKILFEMIARAESFLSTEDLSSYTIIKWETESWGEIPADFGRK